LKEKWGVECEWRRKIICLVNLYVKILNYSPNLHIVHVVQAGKKDEWMMKKGFFLEFSQANHHRLSSEMKGGGEICQKMTDGARDKLKNNDIRAASSPYWSEEHPYWPPVITC
jgi:hypothetical protein